MWINLCELVFCMKFSLCHSWWSKQEVKLSQANNGYLQKLLSSFLFCSFLWLRRLILCDLFVVHVSEYSIIDIIKQYVNPVVQESLTTLFWYLIAKFPFVILIFQGLSLSEMVKYMFPTPRVSLMKKILSLESQAPCGSSVEHY